MAIILDADTHIAEPPEMWNFLDPEWYPRRPVVVAVPEDTQYGGSDHMWLIDGQIFPKPAGRGGNLLVTPTSQKNVRDRADVKARELLDLPMRFEDMNATNVDAQVVYPTLFLAFLTSDVAYEVALCRAYNRYMAGVADKANGRIRWVVVPPLRDINATIEELQFGREHGACGVFFRGIEGDRTLDDPYFFPVYREAEALDLPICIHQGQGAPALNNLVDIKRSHTFTHGRLPPLSAFRNIVANRIPEEFPLLRWGFIETGASWIPFVLYQLRGTNRADETFWGPRLFEEYRIWVSYELGEAGVLGGSPLVGYFAGEVIRTGSSFNYWNLSDPQVDALAAAQAQELDEAKRKQTIDRLQDRLYEIMPWVPTVARIYFYLHSCRTKNMQYIPSNNTHNEQFAYHLWLDPTGC